MGCIPIKNGYTRKRSPLSESKTREPAKRLAPASPGLFSASELVAESPSFRQCPRDRVDVLAVDIPVDSVVAVHPLQMSTGKLQRGHVSSKDRALVANREKPRLVADESLP